MSSFEQFKSLPEDYVFGTTFVLFEGGTKYEKFMLHLVPSTMPLKKLQCFVR
jgi:hypothetical protein